MNPMDAAFDELHQAACDVEASHWAAGIGVPRIALAAEPAEWRKAPRAAVDRFLRELSRARTILSCALRDAHGAEAERALLRVRDAQARLFAAYEALVVALVTAHFAPKTPPVPITVPGPITINAPRRGVA
jgi:hypothetical protein